MVAKIIPLDNRTGPSLSPSPEGERGTFLSRDGVRVFFEDSGGAGPAVFFIYGLACTVDHWRHQRRYLDETRFQSNKVRQLFIDYRGQGLSERPPKGQPLTMEMIAGDIIELCELRGIQSVFLLGQSMGGCIAIRVAERKPDLVKGMVLVASPSQDPSKGLPVQPLSPWLWRAAIAINDQAPLAARLLHRLIGHTRKSVLTHPKALRLAIREIARYQGFNPDLAQTEDVENYIEQVFSVPTDLFLEMAGDLRRFDVAKINPPILAPTLIVAGDADLVVPIESAQRLEQFLPNSEFHLVPHGSHCPHIDDPSLVNRLVEKFIRDRL